MAVCGFRARNIRIFYEGVLLMSELFRCFNRKGLETVLPHRGTALRKIDGVFHLEGHFPGAPTYPGYAQDEFICLVAAALLSLTNKGLKANPHVVQKTVRYKIKAVPGDTLIAEVKLTGRKGRFIIFSGQIRNQNQELVAHYEKIVGAI